MRKGLDILVVDDEPGVRQALKCLLEHGGHKVGAVEGGVAALALLQQRTFDVVITDFSMPGMRGDQLVKRIRQLVPVQRIIMVTAFAEDYTVLGQPDLGVDALLAKPFSFKDLTLTIERVMAKEDDFAGVAVLERA